MCYKLYGVVYFMIQRFLPILLLSFVNVIGFSLLIPVLPDVVAKYSPQEWQGVTYGALISVFAICQFLAAPILGSLSDRYGRRPILYLSQLGTTIGWIIFALSFLADGLWIGRFGLPLIIMAIARTVDGITGGNISVANAWISDVTTREERTKAFGLMGATFGVGFLIGPALGGLANATPWGYVATALIAVVVSLITLAVIYFMLPETLPPEKRDDHVDIHFFKEINVFDKFRRFSRTTFLRKLLVVRLLFAAVFASYVTVVMLYLKDGFELDPSHLGFTLSVIGVFSVINQAVLAHKVSAKVGALKTVVISLVLIAVALAILPLIPLGWHYGKINISLGLFLLNAYLMNMGISISNPAYKSVLTTHVSEKQQGMVTGLDESILALGNSVTPVVAGGLYSLTGGRIFWLYSVIMAACLLVAPREEKES